MKFLILSVLVISTMMVSIEARHGANLTGALAELESVSEEKNHNYGRKLRNRVDYRTTVVTEQQAQSFNAEQKKEEAKNKQQNYQNNQTNDQNCKRDEENRRRNQENQKRNQENQKRNEENARKQGQTPENDD